MKNKIVILIVGVNLAGLVMLAVFYPHLMVSPGKPIDAHADIAADCFACHTQALSLIHISEPTRPTRASRMPSSA